jgi:hypothetical protein
MRSENRTCEKTANPTVVHVPTRSEAKAEEERRFETKTQPLIALHIELSDVQLRKHLLQLALFVRTYDDLMRDSEDAEAYNEHASKFDGDDTLGWISEGPLGLREACNKIIHAQEIRPAYDRLDRTVVDGQDDNEETLIFLTGEVELRGMRNGKSWEGAVDLTAFIETVLERISFQGSTNNDDAVSKPA